ncbi:winged helix-turn-helix transcriptional regulator [Gimibacter soli]|uniref:Helix-turn-helix domain-containing protein n=1 Tax=Gimibacter soli TaxID=3024400 RepID=A0AAF0BIB8_9PROT|nr:helix-turn-helix domain-containing protein [Gimibacter soli]WCL55198.1 helix-turn-helix domain-containing protein [Gimibacter soli]
MRYGQFCPIAKANEILGEKWTILIIRELLMGARRFNELQRGLGLISPALLTTRLKALEDQGMVVRRQIGGQRGFEYFPSKAAEEMLPVLVAMGEWGLCWARRNLSDSDYDAEFLMYYLERSIMPESLPGNETVIRFEFPDYETQKNWWLVVNRDTVEVCIKDPGRDVDVFLSSSVRTMADVWMGDRSYRSAVKDGDLSVVGPSSLTRNLFDWLRPSIFAESPRPPVSGAAA